MKKFGKRYLATKKALKDFIKEIEVLNQLRHPNVVQYLGVSYEQPLNEQSGGIYYMVTEFVSRGSLFEVLHQRRQSLDDYRILLIAK